MRKAYGFCGVFSLILAMAARLAGAASTVPVGPEFQINTYTTDDQGGVGPTAYYGKAVCSDPAGNFTVVWTSHNQATPIGNGTMIFGQRYDSSGAKMGTEFQVNSFTSSIPYDPAITCDANGFQVVWFDSNTNLSGRRFDSSGVPQGTEFALTPTNPAHFAERIDGKLSTGLSMCRGTSGDGVVVYASNVAGSHEVFGQRFDSTGAKVGTEFQVNSYTTGYQYAQSVACDPAGNFVVVWESGDPFGGGPDGSSLGIAGQRYNSSGTPLGTEFLVNTYTTSLQWQPSVARDASGNFVVVWANGSDVRGQRFNSSGVAQGSEFPVNSSPSFAPQGIRVSSDATGDFAVAWGGNADPRQSNTWAIRSRAFDSTGTAQAPDFLVNSYIAPLIDTPDVAMRGDGKSFVVAWTQMCNQGSLGACEDGSGNGVFGQRFAIGHDAVAFAPLPVNVIIPKNPANPKTVKVSVKVRNADPKTEVPSDSIKLTVDRNDCPAGMGIDAPNFSKAGDPPSDTALLAGTKSATAKIALTIHSMDFATYNGKSPKRCTLMVTATTQVAGNLDPTPENNVVPVEINVVDKNVTESSTVHDSVIKSISPVNLSITKGKGGVTKKVLATVSNADYLVMNDTHDVKLSVDPASITSCPWLTVNSIDVDPADGDQDTTTLGGGKAHGGKVVVTLDSSVTTKNAQSPARCVALFKADTEVMGNVEPDSSNNATRVVIDVIDKNDP